MMCCLLLLCRVAAVLVHVGCRALSRLHMAATSAAAYWCVVVCDTVTSKWFRSRILPAVVVMLDACM
jgi:hypothetical protein